MMIEVYFSEIDESKYGEWISRLEKLVSAEKFERAMRMRFPADRLLTLCAEALARRLACRWLGVENRDIIFELNQYGKPYVKGCHDFHFNVSHTRSALAVAVSDSEVGVDVERTGAADLKIAGRFFAAPENEYIQQSPDRNKAFYEIWTKKEAYIKYTGQGLSQALESFDTLSGEISSIIKTVEQGGYIMSVCGAGPERTVISVLTGEEIFRV